MKNQHNNFKLWQARYILSVKILLSVVFAGTVGFVFYHVPYTSIFLFPIYILGAFYLLWLYAMEDAKFGMIREWQDWVDQQMQSQEYVDALLFIHHRQIESSLDPTAPFIDFTTRDDLTYQAFLESKFKNKPFVQEMYK